MDVMDGMTIEFCTLCGCETPYNWFTYVNERMWYVKGSGQLCEKCWNETYIEK